MQFLLTNNRILNWASAGLIKKIISTSARSVSVKILQNIAETHQSKLSFSKSSQPDEIILFPPSCNSLFSQQDFKLRQHWNISFDDGIIKGYRDFIYRLEVIAKDEGYSLQNLKKILHLFLTTAGWFWLICDH